MAKPVNPEEAKSFDLFDEPQLEVQDRTTLENYASCPFMANAVETGKVMTSSNAANSGEAVHHAISETIQWWVDTDGGAEMAYGVRSAIVEWLEGELKHSRPDVQPNAIAGARASLWAFAEYLSGIRPANILGFDGGVGRYSSQLAIDLGAMGVRATSELDLITSSPDSTELICLDDWKSGNTRHTAASVKASFQFQFHAVLLFHRYPKVQAVEVRIWDTRLNRRTHAVQFERRDFDAYLARVRMAATQREKLKHTGGDPETWPSVEKCRVCEAACICPEADDLAKTATTEPEQLLGKLIATQAREKQLKKLLTAVIDKTGKPVVLEKHAYGRQFKSEPKAQIYPIKADVDGDAGESEEAPE
jgi:hypothetical protein